MEKAVATLAVFVLLALPDVASAGHRRADCYPRGSVTEVVSDTARIYFFRSTGRTFACSFRYGRRIRLGSSEEEIHSLAVTDRFALFFIHWCEGAGACYTDVEERDLRTGRREFYVSNDDPARQRSEPGGDEGFLTVADAILKRNGSAAWLACQGNDGECERSADRVLLVRDARGLRAVATGRIWMGSLRLSKDRRRVAWIEAGQRRYAAIR